jgi:hypothetical protein
MGDRGFPDRGLPKAPANPAFRRAARPARAHHDHAERPPSTQQRADTWSGGEARRVGRALVPFVQPDGGTRPMASTTATPFVGSHSHESICPVGIPRARLDSGRLSLRHPAYRDFERWRIETNDAGVAVLLGLRLGRAHLLGLPPALRRERLPELVDIEDAWRLNLPGDEVIEADA